MKWSSKSLGGRAQHGFFFCLVRCRMQWLARIFLVPVTLFYVLRPAIRRRAYPYLRRRFPRSWILPWHCFRLYLCFAQILLDRVVAGVRGSFPHVSETPEHETFQGALTQDGGCIVLSAHIGMWQLGLMGVEELRPMSIVQLRHPGDVDRHYFEYSQKGRHAAHLIDSHDGVAAFVRIVAALRGGEAVCLMGDRLLGEERDVVEVTFLGGRIALPTTAFALASITRVPLVITFSVRDNGKIRGAWARRLCIPPGLRHKPEALRPYVQEFAAAMETLTRNYPYQFFNFYDMWLAQ